MFLGASNGLSAGNASRAFFRPMELKGEEINSLLNEVHSTAPATALKPLGDKPPEGYIRAKVYSIGVLLSALVDSGNLFADLISEKLAKTLRLKQPILYSYYFYFLY